MTTSSPLPFRLSLLFLFTLLFLCPGTLSALEFENLSQRIASSLSQVANRKYGTIAFSRIAGPLNQEKINELIDYTNVALVKSRAFRVIDRSKMNLILQEQKFNLSGMVSQDTYKELGKLLGVDLFVYGRYYHDTLVMKAIDVESSAIVWADIFQLTALKAETLAVSSLAEAVTLSLRKDLSRLRQNKVNQIAFWNIQSPFDSSLLADFLSTALTKDSGLQVVDRENLALIIEEQKLSMSDFIDESKAKRMGELYGVDAFIYGKVSRKNGRWLASLKLLNIYNGVIEWADLIHFGQTNRSSYKKSTAKPIAGMISIPKGKFIMGSNQGPQISKPEFQVKLREFYLDETEVSNQKYAEYLRRFRKRPPPHWRNRQIPAGAESLPVVNVTWIEAERYCKSLGKRLPKEVEWEKAARGENGLTYPWGNGFNPRKARTLESGKHKPLPVDQAQADISPYGVQQMAGNVREWVSSSLARYPGSNFDSPQINREKVIRGGSWAKTKDHATTWHRASSKPNYAWKDVGFRCAK